MAIVRSYCNPRNGLDYAPHEDRWTGVRSCAMHCPYCDALGPDAEQDDPEAVSIFEREHAKGACLDSDRTVASEGE
jgi:hypothetical protein